MALKGEYMRLCTVLVLLLMSTSQLVGQSGSLERVRSSELWIPLAGRAVIRDSADWAVLWHRFGRIGYQEGQLIRPDPPKVDFQESVLIAVSMGRLSGCDNTAHYVQRIHDTVDSVVVDVGWEELGPNMTCAAEISPVDVVRLPRSSQRIVFHQYWDEVPEPGPANWWQTPSVGELDRMDPRERGVFMLALALDANTPDDLLGGIARGLSDFDWTVGDILLERPAVRQNPDAVYALTRVRGTEKNARRILLEEHGESLASDPRTPAEVLGVLMRELGPGDANRAVWKLLLQHPAVRNDQELLLDFTLYSQHQRDLWLQACSLYLKQWPRTLVVERNAAGEPISFKSTICR